MRRAGHDTTQTTMGYVKLAGDRGGDLDAPFAALPDARVTSSRFSMRSVGLVAQDGVVGHDGELSVSAVEHDRDSSGGARQREGRGARSDRKRTGRSALRSTAENAAP